MAGFDDPYIPRMASLGEHNGAFGSATGFIEGLNQLNTTVKHIQLQRSVSAANDELQGLALQDASEHDMTQRRNELAQQLGQQMITSGFPATSVQELQKTFNPIQTKPQFTNIAELAAYGTPEQRQNLLDFYSKYKPPKEAKEADPNATDFKTDAKKQALFSKFSRDIQPDSSARSVLAQSMITQNRAQNLIALMGPDTTVAALNKMQPNFVTEAASSVATMVKNGQITQDELHQFLPNTSGMTSAKALQYITNMPESANAGGFLKLYLHAATRESSLNAQTVAESILSKAQGNAVLYKLDKDQYRNMVASALKTHAQKALSPEDIVIDDRGRVSTTEQQTMDKKFKLYSDALGEAKMKLRSKDPKESEKAQQFFQKLGLEPDFGVSEMKAILKARIRGGMY